MLLLLAPSTRWMGGGGEDGTGEGREKGRRERLGQGRGNGKTGIGWEGKAEGMKDEGMDGMRWERRRVRGRVGYKERGKRTRDDWHVRGIDNVKWISKIRKGGKVKMESIYDKGRDGRRMNGHSGSEERKGMKEAEEVRGIGNEKRGKSCYWYVEHEGKRKD